MCSWLPSKHWRDQETWKLRCKTVRAPAPELLCGKGEVSSLVIDAAVVRECCGCATYMRRRCVILTNAVACFCSMDEYSARAFEALSGVETIP